MNSSLQLFYSVLISIVVFTSLQGQSKFIIGADVSYLDQIERHGGVYKDSGKIKDVLQILKDHGYTHIRLRIWHTPVDSINDLTSTISIAKRVKLLNMKLLLDFHYSDTWADPANQTKPKVWQNSSFAALKESVYTYTRSVLLRMKNENVYPEMIQIGNETICGMLWYDGNVCGSYNNATQWSQYAALVKEGVRAIRETENDSGSTKIILHIDKGGDSNASQWFFDNITAQQIPFDIIGLSFYPWWHGTFSQLDDNIRLLISRYSKQVLVVETAYPWTLQWNDNSTNIVGSESQLLSGYPATPDGQAKFLKDLSSLLMMIPDGKAFGLFYWAPEYIVAPGMGSVWENVTLFNFSGDALKSVGAITAVQENIYKTERPLEFNLFQNYPNPFNGKTVIQFSLSHADNISIKIFDQLGRELGTITDQWFNAGMNSVTFNAVNLPSGLYICRLSAKTTVQAGKIVLIK